MANEDLMRHALQIAEVGDRWFMVFAKRLGRLGVWARSEADIATDSAIAAFATTVSITKRLTRRGRPPMPPGETASESRRKTSEPRIDLLEANPAPPTKRRRAEKNGVAVRTGPKDADNPPGVVPLVKALGRLVASHSESDYASLESDQRFWMLVCVLQALKKTARPRPKDETQASETTAAPSRSRPRTGTKNGREVRARPARQP